LQYILSKDLCNFKGVQWAAITDFALGSVLDDLANLGSGDIFEFGGDRGDLIVEQSQDFIIVSNGTSSHVADETTVALSRFGIGQNSESGVIAVFSRTLGTGSESSNKDAFEDGNTSEDSKGSKASRGESCGCGSSSSANNNSGIGNAGGQGHKGEGSNKHVHDDELRVWFFCVFLRKTEN
jgi:hypothetical protein